ncbi:hypothetical protein ACLOJK_020440 [Asimina triloba]
MIQILVWIATKVVVLPGQDFLDFLQEVVIYAKALQAINHHHRFQWMMYTGENAADLLNFFNLVGMSKHLLVDGESGGWERIGGSATETRGVLGLFLRATLLAVRRPAIEEESKECPPQKAMAIG